MPSAAAERFVQEQTRQGEAIIAEKEAEMRAKFDQQQKLKEEKMSQSNNQVRQRECKYCP